MTGTDCPSCRLSWRGHDNTVCERARIIRAVVEWRAALARYRGLMARGPRLPVLADGAREARAAKARYETATAGIPEAVRLAGAISNEYTSLARTFDNPRGRANYVLGCCHVPSSHPVHANVREALKALLDAHAPA
jgi:hypothetical protein